MRKAATKKVISLVLLDICACLVIAYTAWLGNFGDWITENLSVVAYWHGHEKMLIVWGWICGAVFVAFLTWLMYLYGFKSRLVRVFTALSGLLLVIGVYLPYQPGQHPYLSNVHIGVSFMAPVSVMSAIICLVVHLLKRSMPFMRSMTVLLVFLTAIAAVIFVYCTIITTLLEVYVVSALSVYMTLLGILGIRYADRLEV